MEPGERILSILMGKPIDRIPVDLSLTHEIEDILKSHYQVATDLELFRAMHLDKIVWAFPDYEGIPMIQRGNMSETSRSIWGAKTRLIDTGLATYEEKIEHPLAGMADPRDLDDFAHWPDPARFNIQSAKKRRVLSTERPTPRRRSRPVQVTYFSRGD